MNAASMRHLLVRDAVLGEKLICALLRRRELLESTGFEGLRVYGSHTDGATLQIREFFYRNGVTHRWIDTGLPENEKLTKALREGTPGEGDLNFPVVAWSNHALMQNPTLTEVACKIGVLQDLPPEIYDTVIIGCGPAGLGAAVYAASEGLKTVVLDRIGPGGQAGSSSRIENYAGFPSGISGRDLAMRSYVQALKFGALFSAPVSVKEIKCASGDLHEVTTDLDTVIRTKTIIVATGVTYKGLDVPGLRELAWRGVYFSATQVEAQLCKDRPVHVIGAGNSAGQAAMYLSKFTEHVMLIVRGGDLRKSMSTYLAERVEVNPRIAIRLHHELRGVEGGKSLERVRLEETTTRREVVEESAGVFVFIGAEPHTGFIGDVLKKDPRGFLMTGADVAGCGAWTLKERAPCALETSCPGVFAAGDCRSRTTKRVAFAVGDGALAVTCVHDFLGTYN